MNPKQLISAFKQEFERRKFVGGLLVAFIRFFRELNAFSRRFSDLDSLFQEYPQLTITAQGKTANTLILSTQIDGGKPRSCSIRPFYNKVETYFRHEQKRFDYPNCAPHATQAWHDYRDWLESLLSFSDEQADALEAQVIAYVLEKLPSHAFDAEGLEPLEQRFTSLLQGFEFAAAKGEPSGSAFQGVIFAYIRADAPHLHLDVAKVGAGSKRLQRVGDIDGWEGERLILSAEVKHFQLKQNDVPDLSNFASEVSKRKAMGIVVASSFADEARVDLEGLGLRTLDADDLLRIVELWDPLKQRAAVAAFTYYAHHIEKNMVLIKRLRTFMAQINNPSE